MVFKFISLFDFKRHKRKINFNFDFSKCDVSNCFLQTVGYYVIDNFLDCVDSSQIDGILLTGSLANGEGTVVNYDSKIFCSDFDYVIWVKFPYFLIRKDYFINLSRKISRNLVKNFGINTHVCFVPTNRIFYSELGLGWPQIYKYEFTCSSKCVFGKSPLLKVCVFPSSKDALELIFTVISDIVFMRIDTVSKVEETYVYAKRALTLLNAILILFGLPSETYQKRLWSGKKSCVYSNFPFAKKEMEILELFMNYKITGSLDGLLDSMDFGTIDDLLIFQKNFLKTIAKKSLYYALELYVGKVSVKDFKFQKSLFDLESELLVLLQDYLKNSDGSLFSRFFWILTSFFWVVKGNDKRAKLYRTYFYSKKPPKVILNVALSLFFLEKQLLVEKFLRITLPWIDFHSADVYETLHSLWVAR